MFPVMKNHSKIHMKQWKTKIIVILTLRKKNSAGGVQFQVSKYVIKLMYKNSILQEKGLVDQWNKIE